MQWKCWYFLLYIYINQCRKQLNIFIKKLSIFIVFYGFERCMISMVQCDLMYLPKGQSFTGDFGTEFTVTSTIILKCSFTICIQWIWLNRKRPGYIYQMAMLQVGLQYKSFPISISLGIIDLQLSEHFGNLRTENIRQVHMKITADLTT